MQRLAQVLFSLTFLILATSSHADPTIPNDPPVATPTPTPTPEPVATPTPEPTPTVASLQLYTMQEAVNDALSEPLTYVGSFMPYYSDSQKYPTCVFKNSKVYVASSYCVKDDVPAGHFRIHPVDPAKGFADIYAETDQKKDISDVGREDYYDVLWHFSSQISEPAFTAGIDAKAYQIFDAILVKGRFDGCITSYTFRTEKNSSYCSSDYSGQFDSWSATSLDQWKTPPKEWFKFLSTVRQQIKNLPFDPY